VSPTENCVDHACRSRDPYRRWFLVHLDPNRSSDGLSGNTATSAAVKSRLTMPIRYDASFWHFGVYPGFRFRRILRRWFSHRPSFHRHAHRSRFEFAYPIRPLIAAAEKRATRILNLSVAPVCRSSPTSQAVQKRADHLRVFRITRDPPVCNPLTD